MLSYEKAPEKIRPIGKKEKKKKTHKLCGKKIPDKRTRNEKALTRRRPMMMA